MPIHPTDFDGILELIKRLDQIVKGLAAQAKQDDQRITPEGEPAPRHTRLR